MKTVRLLEEEVVILQQDDREKWGGFAERTQVAIVDAINKIYDNTDGDLITSLRRDIDQEIERSKREDGVISQRITNEVNARLEAIRRLQEQIDGLCANSGSGNTNTGSDTGTGDNNAGGGSDEYCSCSCSIRKHRLPINHFYQAGIAHNISFNNIDCREDDTLILQPNAVFASLLQGASFALNGVTRGQGTGIQLILWLSQDVNFSTVQGAEVIATIISDNKENQGV